MQFCTFSIHQTIVLLSISSLSLLLPPHFPLGNTRRCHYTSHLVENFTGTSSQHSSLFYSHHSNSLVSSCLQIKPLSFSRCLLVSLRETAHPRMICSFILLPFFLAKQPVINCRSGFSVSASENLQKHNAVSHLGGGWVSFIMEENNRLPLPAQTHRLVTADRETDAECSPKRLQIHLCYISSNLIK